MPTQPELEVVMCCIPRDLPLARLAVDGIIHHLTVKTISIATRANAFAESRNVLGSDVQLIDERELSGGISLPELRDKTNLAGFPNRAGWYFQQLVKLGYALRGNSTEYYLIWDCDTVLLRPLDFFSSEGHPLYTMADEQHLPYFQTYQCLFGYMPDFEESFISQHMVVNKAIACEMLGELSTRHPSDLSWSWAIMNNLAQVRSISLFSEYETYGHYVKSRYPETIGFRRLPWLREAAAHINSTKPSPQQLSKLSQDYYFAAFEGWHLRPSSRLRRRAYNFMREIFSRNHIE